MSSKKEWTSAQVEAAGLIAREMVLSPPTDTEVEAAAKALYALENRANSGWTWEKESVSDELRNYWLESGRAAIEAFLKARRG